MAYFSNRRIAATRKRRSRSPSRRCAPAEERRRRSGLASSRRTRRRRRRPSRRRRELRCIRAPVERLAAPSRRRRAAGRSSLVPPRDAARDEQAATRRLDASARRRRRRSAPPRARRPRSSSVVLCRAAAADVRWSLAESPSFDGDGLAEAPVGAPDEGRTPRGSAPACAPASRRSRCRCRRSRRPRCRRARGGVPSRRLRRRAAAAGRPTARRGGAVVPLRERRVARRGDRAGHRRAAELAGARPHQRVGHGLWVRTAPRRRPRLARLHRVDLVERRHRVVVVVLWRWWSRGRRGSSRRRSRRRCWSWLDAHAVFAPATRQARRRRRRASTLRAPSWGPARRADAGESAQFSRQSGRARGCLPGLGRYSRRKFAPSSSSDAAQRPFRSANIVRAASRRAPLGRRPWTKRTTSPSSRSRPSSAPRPRTNGRRSGRAR